VHDGFAARRRAPDRRGVKQIIAVSAVEAEDIVTELFQMSGYRRADVTTMARDQNAHRSMITRRSPNRYRDTEAFGSHPGTVRDKRFFLTWANVGQTASDKVREDQT
jgi:hypothetical protein